MKQSVVLVLTAVLYTWLAGTAGAEDARVVSLRGDVPLSDQAVEPTSKEWQPAQKALIERNFDEQPPLIPHDVEGFQITSSSNTCLACHSRAMAKATGAPEPKQSHYLDRDGNELEEISSRRYFCNQCHVRQVVAEPLVGNTYTPPAGG